MGLYDAINNVISPVFDPLLNLSPFFGILIISLVISVIVTFIYKWVTDQELMKTLKTDIKELQSEMKKFKQHPEKMMAINKKMMEKNTQYMKHTLKPTLFTFLPLILIIGWLSTTYAYDPISPGESFTVYALMSDVTVGDASIGIPEGIRLLSGNTSEVVRIPKEDNPKSLPFENTQLTKAASSREKLIEPGTDIYYARWDLSANKGTHVIDITVNNQTYAKEITVSKKTYGKIVDVIDDANLRGIFVDRGKLVVFNLFGWKIGWLGTYIIFSLIFSMGLRKILKVH